MALNFLNGKFLKRRTKSGHQEEREHFQGPLRASRWGCPIARGQVRARAGFESCGTRSSKSE